MSDLGTGIAWAGFWIMIGLSNFGENRINHVLSFDSKVEQKVEVIEIAEYIESKLTTKEAK